MAEMCHKTQDIDLALFLLEPHGLEWQEFRAHYPQCVFCSAELQKWTSLEHRLRLLGNASATTHPSAETLVQFQQQPNVLSPKVRQIIARHVSTCAPCRDEVKQLASFDPVRIAQWATPTPKTVASVNVSEAWSERVWQTVRSWFLHPAFATGLVLLLSVPFIRSYYLSSVTQTPVSPDIAHEFAPLSAPAEEERQVQQIPPGHVAGRQAAEPPPQAGATTLPSHQQPSPVASVPSKMAVPETEKAKENAHPAQFAKRTAQEKDPMHLDEHAPAVAPAPAAPPLGTGISRRDEQIRLQHKGNLAAEEKKQRALSAPQKPALADKREARSTEEPITELRRRKEDSPPVSLTASAPVQTAAHSQAPIGLQESHLRDILFALIEKYKRAYETRDIHSLTSVWNIDQAWQEALVQLFASNQQISVMVTLDENNLIASADQRQVTIPLTQFVTTVSRDGQTLTQGPLYCLADVRKQSAELWKIHALQEDTQHPGQCRLP